MNKQEAIGTLQDVAQRVFYRTGSRSVYIDKIVEIINQIDEPKKVVIPQFVAEWIEECKRSGWHLRKALYRLVDDMEVSNWVYDENEDLIPEKVDMIARVWLDGYEIEQEQLYTVKIPNPNLNAHTILQKAENGKIALVALHKPNTSCLKNKEYQLTESEIKQDFEWAFQFAKPVEE